jgi:hypothetical protein
VVTAADLRAWQDFRAGLRALGQTDPERARLYLEGAALSLRSWEKSIREQQPRLAHSINQGRRR